LPDDVFTFALMPIGYPIEKYGPLTRRPVSEVTFSERWGEKWPSPHRCNEKFLGPET
jgi:hypothetical protein